MPHLLELFAGSCQVSRVFRDHGYSVDCWENDAKILKRAQIEGLSVQNVHLFPTETYPVSVHVLWASPPCHFYFSRLEKGVYVPNPRGEVGLENV